MSKRFVIVLNYFHYLPPLYKCEKFYKNVQKIISGVEGNFKHFYGERKLCWFISWQKRICLSQFFWTSCIYSFFREIEVGICYAHFINTMHKNINIQFHGYYRTSNPKLIIQLWSNFYRYFSKKCSHRICLGLFHVFSIVYSWWMLLY